VQPHIPPLRYSMGHPRVYHTHSSLSLVAMRPPSFSATSTSRLCSATHVTDAFLDIKSGVTGIFVNQNWTHGFDIR
jgi:hypothetical protein